MPHDLQTLADEILTARRSALLDESEALKTSFGAAQAHMREHVWLAGFVKDLIADTGILEYEIDLDYLWDNETRTLSHLYLFRYGLHEWPDADRFYASPFYALRLRWRHGRCHLNGQSFDPVADAGALLETVADVVRAIVIEGSEGISDVVRVPEDLYPGVMSSGAAAPAGQSNAVTGLKVSAVSGGLAVALPGRKVDLGGNDLALKSDRSIALSASAGVEIETESILRMQASMIQLEGVVMINGRQL